jgi:hypothetical protein
VLPHQPNNSHAALAIIRNQSGMKSEVMKKSRFAAVGNRGNGARECKLFVCPSD